MNDHSDDDTAPINSSEYVSEQTLVTSSVITGVVTFAATIASVVAGNWFWPGATTKDPNIEIPKRIEELEGQMSDVKENLKVTGEQSKRAEGKIDKLLDMVRQIDD